MGNPTQHDMAGIDLIVNSIRTGASEPGATGTAVSGASTISATTGESFSGSTTVAADVLAIPVTHQIVQKTTGADAEALTLANGTNGQFLTIVLVADGGGDGTLTPTTKTGFATIVFADAGDHATLRYVDGTVGWVLVGTGGVAAPPAISV